MKEHKTVFKVLRSMQDAYYKSDDRRERFVSLCHDVDVQRLTFEAYMNKKLVKARPLAHLKIGVKNVAHLTGLVPGWSDDDDLKMIPAWVDGTLTPVEKLEVHQRGLRHKAVSVFVMAGRRGADPAPGAGQVSHAGPLGEHLLHASRCGTKTPPTCAVRRLREELGITGLYPSFAGPGGIPRRCRAAG